MKTTLGILFAVYAAGVVCNAQDNNALIRQKIEAELATQMKVVSLKGSMMGSVVKNAAYSGTEIVEHKQTLSDGTLIRNETDTKVFRDNAGRIRRESQNEINIWDPVDQVGYLLNPKTLIAQRLPFARSASVTTGQDGTSIYLKSLQRNSETKLQAELVLQGIEAANKKAEEIRHSVAAQAEEKSGQKFFVSDAVMTLGTRSFDGVLAEGKRQIHTLPVNSIGNDRPISITTERWYSPELSLEVLSKSADPRFGENTFRLTHIVRSEPAADLFQVPPAYRLVERK